MHDLRCEPESTVCAGPWVLRDGYATATVRVDGVEYLHIGVLTDRYGLPGGTPHPARTQPGMVTCGGARTRGSTVTQWHD